LGDLVVDGRTILNYVLSKQNVLVSAEDRDRWRAVLRAVIRIDVPMNARNISIGRELVSF